MSMDDRADQRGGATSPPSAGSQSPTRLSWLERYVRFVVRHRVVVLVAIGALTALLALQLMHVHLEIRRRANLPDDHPYVKVQNRISDLFGGESIVIIGVIANDGNIFTPELLGKVQRITERLRRAPSIIEPSLFSLAAPYVKVVVSGPDDSMDVRPLMAEPPTTPEAVEAVRAAVRRDRLFRDTLVGRDESAALIVADFDDRIKDAELAAIIEGAVAPERDEKVTVALAGAPILRAALARYTAMMGILFPLAVVVIGLVHYEAFRTVQAMLLPLATALLSVIWSLGIIGALRQPMDTWSALTPVLILAIAAGHAVQILKRYYEEFARCGDNAEAVVRSIVAVGPVMLTAGCIAASGFASLMTFGISSIRAFGLLLAAGILSALVIEMTFTPACRSLLPAPRRREILREGQTGWLDRILEVVGRFVVTRPTTVLSCALVVVVVAALGVTQIEIDNSFRLWFAPSSSVRIDDGRLNQALAGTATLRILIEGQEDGVLLRPDVLRAIDDFEVELGRDPRVGGITSIADHLKRLNQAMNDGDPAAYAIPDDPGVIGEYLFLYGASAGPDGLSAFIDAANRRAVIRALSKTDSAAFSHELIERLHAFAARRFNGLPVTVGIAGGTLGVQTAMNDVIVRDKVANVMQVSAIIFVLCALVMRSIVAGLFVLIPLFAAVGVTLGLMGWSGVWLDMFTAAATAMAISVGADFAIYFLYRVREELQRSAGLPEAVLSSLRTSGKAIFYVSSAVALGYLVLPFSGFSLWIRLGLLTATTVSVSGIATLTVLPALSLVGRPAFLRDAAEPAPLALPAQHEISPR
jgi:hydrophobe/amphiphile efflux-3 (HAE3) family protein